MPFDPTLAKPFTATPSGADVLVRRRPWTMPQDHRSTVSIENLIFADKSNVKYVHVSASSTDKGLVNGELPTYAGMIVRNCLFQRLTKTISGLHIDAIKVDGSSQKTIAPSLLIENCTFEDIGPGAMPIHASDGGVGGYDTITLRGLRFARCAHPVHIGGRCPVRQLIVRDCPGIQIIGDGDVSGVAVVVESSPGAVVFGKPYAGATPTPPPPVDPHAACKASLDFVTSERDAARAEVGRLNAKIAKALEDLR